MYSLIHDDFRRDNPLDLPLIRLFKRIFLLETLQKRVIQVKDVIIVFDETIDPIRYHISFKGKYYFFTKFSENEKMVRNKYCVDKEFYYN